MLLHDKLQRVFACIAAVWVLLPQTPLAQSLPKGAPKTFEVTPRSPFKANGGGDGYAIDFQLTTVVTSLNPPTGFAKVGVKGGEFSISLEKQEDIQPAFECVFAIANSLKARINALANYDGKNTGLGAFNFSDKSIWKFSLSEKPKGTTPIVITFTNIGDNDFTFESCKIIY